MRFFAKYQLLYFAVVCTSLLTALSPSIGHARPVVLWYTDDFLQDSDGPEGIEKYEKLSLDMSRPGTTSSRTAVYGISNDRPVDNLYGIQTAMGLGMLSNWMRPGLKFAIPGHGFPLLGCGTLPYASYGNRVRMLFPSSIRTDNLLSWSDAWDYFIQQVIARDGIPVIYNSGQSGELAAKLETNPNYYYSLIRDRGGLIVGAGPGGTNGCDGGGGLIAQRAAEYGIIQGGGTLSNDMWNGRSWPDHKMGTYNYEGRRGNHGNDPRNPWSWAIDSHLANAAPELFNVLETTGIPNDAHFIRLRGRADLTVGFRWYNPRDPNPATNFAAPSVDHPNNRRSSLNTAFFLEPHPDPARFNAQVFLQDHLAVHARPTLHETLGKVPSTGYASFDHLDTGTNGDTTPYFVTSGATYSIHPNPRPMNPFNGSDKVLAVDADSFIVQTRPFDNRVGGSAYTSIVQQDCGSSDSSGPEFVVSPDGRQYKTTQTTRVRMMRAGSGSSPDAMKLAVLDGESENAREYSAPFTVMRDPAANSLNYDISATHTAGRVQVRVNGVLRHTFEPMVPTPDLFYIHFGASVSSSCQARSGNAIMLRYLHTQSSAQTFTVEKTEPYRTTLIFAHPSDVWSDIHANNYELAWNNTRLSLIQALTQGLSRVAWSAEGGTNLLAVTFDDRDSHGNYLFWPHLIFSLFRNGRLEDMEYFS